MVDDELLGELGELEELDVEPELLPLEDFLCFLLGAVVEVSLDEPVAAPAPVDDGSLEDAPLELLLGEDPGVVELGDDDDAAGGVVPDVVAADPGVYPDEPDAELGVCAKAGSASIKAKLVPKIKVLRILYLPQTPPQRLFSRRLNPNARRAIWRQKIFGKTGISSNCG